jgi:hypothetical protein
VTIVSARRRAPACAHGAVRVVRPARAIARGTDRPRRAARRTRPSRSTRLQLCPSIDFRPAESSSTRCSRRAAARIRAFVHPQVRSLLPADPDPGASSIAVYRSSAPPLDQYVVIPLVHVPDTWDRRQRGVVDAGRTDRVAVVRARSRERVAADGTP